MKVLFIGDIVGRLGREATAKLLPTLKNDGSINLCIANAENSASGRGINLKALNEIEKCGVDYFTSGDHVYSLTTFSDEIDNAPIVRPANYTQDAPGRGYLVIDLGKLGKYLLINLQGSHYMKVTAENPFKTVDLILNNFSSIADIKGIFVDFHAEETSEKVAMGNYLDGRVSVVVGTHTHVPTADARILPNGTAYVSDLGMVGALDSVLGVKKDISIERFISSNPRKIEWEDEGPAVFNSVLVVLDDKSGKAISIERVDKIVD